MAIRALTSLEKHCVDLILEGANATGWEYAAYLDPNNGALIELLTRQSAIGADPCQYLIDMAKNGTKFVVHHNHPSQGSLSLTDWYGAAELNFEEIFAYSGDGTIYWGKAIDFPKLKELSSSNPIDLLADRLLADRLIRENCFEALSDVPSRFAYEVANRAMKIRGYVDYDVQWGSAHVPMAPNAILPLGGAPVHVLAKQFEYFFDVAAADLAKQI